MSTANLFINGEWKSALEDGTREILNPADNQAIYAGLITKPLVQTFEVPDPNITATVSTPTSKSSRSTST